MQPEHLQEIKGYYLADARVHLQVIEQHLLNLQSTVEDPEQLSELFHATRCGIVGGASLLPISHLHISSLHKTGLCLGDCFNVFQREKAVKVDQKLQDLLMHVFYTLKQLIEALGESSSLTDEEIAQIMSEIEPVRASIIAHQKWLIHRSRPGSDPEAAIASDSADEVPSLSDLQSLIDDLLLDSSAKNI